MSPPQRTIIKPFEARNVAEFTLEPAGDSTNVTWAMHRTNNYMSKVMSLLLDVDKMIGGQFDAGLANLKALTEK